MTSQWVSAEEWAEMTPEERIDALARHAQRLEERVERMERLTTPELRLKALRQRQEQGQ